MVRERDGFFFHDHARCVDVWTFRRGVKVLVAEIVCFKTGVFSVHGKNYKRLRDAENAVMEAESNV